ncbi:hypothetical protein ACNFCK_20725 [Pseudomonas sp. NY15366]
MKNFSVVILVLVLLGCGESKKASPVTESDFLPAKGWVLIENGSIEEIRAAILDYDSLVREEVPGTFTVELHEQKDGSIAALFPDGLPSYDIANITVWLDAPPNQKNVYGAKSWVSTPDGTSEYFLKPEVENEWGDTLVGSSKSGTSIRIYVPETGMSEIAQTVDYEPEPTISLSSKPMSFSITLDTDISWANPMLSINKPINHDWKY